MGRQTYLPVEILDYIQTHEPSTDEVFGISQRELAKSLGYHPCSMSRPLEELVGKGLLSASRGLVRGASRKQLTYRLTPDGTALLRRETRAVPLLGREIPPPPQPFLGRRDELEELAAASADPGHVTVIEGPPGMGKSALVAAHLRRIRRGHIPFWFTVRPSSTSREFVQGLSHALSFSGKPQLAYYGQLPRPPVPLEAADLAARALGTNVLAMVIDDWQSAPADLAKFLASFVAALRARGPHQFFLVGQQVGLSAAVEAPVRRLTLGGLDRTAAHELTDRHGSLAERFEEVYQATLGSPLLLHLAASNPGVQATPGDLPAAVVRRLPLEDLRAILPAGLANEPLPLNFLAEETPISPSRVQELVRMGILHRSGTDRVAVLEVVRKAIVSRATPAEERDAHLALARFYGRSHRAEAVRERFLHLVSGDDSTTAVRLLEEQQLVILRLGFSEGLRRAFRHLISGLPAGPGRVRVLLAEATLLRYHSDYAESIRVLRQAVAESARNPPLASEARLAIVDQLLRLGQTEEAREEFEFEGRSALRTRRLDTFRLLDRARIEEAVGDSRQAFALYQEAFELSKKARAQDLGLEAIAAWSRLVGLTKGAEAALRVVDEALPQARLANRMDIVFNLLLVRSRAYTEIGRDDLAETEMKAIRSEAESLGYLNQLAYTLTGLAAMSVEKANWAEATTYARQAIAMAEQLGNDLVLGYTLAIQSSSELRQAIASQNEALLDEARTHGERSVEVLRRLPPSESLMLAHGYLAEVWLAKHDPVRARGHYDEALDLGNRLNSSYLRERIQSELEPRLAAAG